MIIQEAFDNFILSRRLQGSKEKTITCYCQTLTPYVNFVGKENDINTINRNDNNKYISDFYMRNLSPATISSYIRQLKVFLRWLEDEYNLDIYAKKIKVPKTRKKVVHIYTDEEIIAIFKSISMECKWLTLRNKCMIALMLDSGLRQNEVCTLMRKNISWNEGILKVCGKGDKERIVPFGNLSRHFMQEYASLCPYESERFFVSNHGEYVTCDALKHMINKLDKKLPFSISSHKLRHNFATNYCLDQYDKYGQVDLYRLMLLMGHEDVETTRLYLHHANQIIATKTNLSHLDMVMGL